MNCDRLFLVLCLFPILGNLCLNKICNKRETRFNCFSS